MEKTTFPWNSVLHHRNQLYRTTRCRHHWPRHKETDVGLHGQIRINYFLNINIFSSNRTRLG